MGSKEKSKDQDITKSKGLEIKAMSCSRENGQNDWVAYDLNVVDFLVRLADDDDHIRIAPWREFGIAGITYYFTPGGFLYRKDVYSDEIGGFFCGYVSDRVWNKKLERHPTFSPTRQMAQSYEEIKEATSSLLGSS